MTHAVQTLPAVDTRKVFVTCHQAVTLPPRHVDERIAAFLKEKVLPVVGDHCRINLHWNGVELSSLHIRSVVPDQCALVPKAVQNRNAPMTALSSSAVSYNGESIAPAAFSPNDIKNEPVDINDEPANVKSEPVLNEVDAKMEFQSSPQTLEAPLDRIISARVTAPSPPKVRASAKLPVLLPKPYPSAPPQPLVASVATIPVVTYGQAPFTPTIFAATTGMAGHIPAQILHLSPSMSASPYSPYGPVQLEESRSVLVNATGPAGERPALTSRIFAPPQQCSATQNAMQATRNTGVASTLAIGDAVLQSDLGTPNGHHTGDFPVENAATEHLSTVVCAPESKMAYQRDQMVGTKAVSTVKKKKFVSKAAYMRDYRRRCKNRAAVQSTEQQGRTSATQECANSEQHQCAQSLPEGQ